jgi:hypothetical protein
VSDLVITGKLSLQLDCQLLSTCLIPSVLNLLLMLQHVLGLPVEVLRQSWLLRILLAVGRQRMLCSVVPLLLLCLDLFSKFMNNGFRGLV